jgi:RNA polymerase sigma factor (sigma-70 family)
VDSTEAFERERPRLTGIAARVLADPVEAEDVVQQAWLRLDRTSAEIETLPAWLTTVTTRLCLDRLRARVATPADEAVPGTAPDPADEVAMTDSVGVALGIVLDRLSPTERIAFVLHDSFDIEFSTIADVLDTTPGAARKLASRARGKVGDGDHERRPAAWEVVDAFMTAAREGEFERLLQLLAPDAAVTADQAAVLVGTPDRIEGRQAVAEFFNGSAQAASAVFVGERPGAAWFHRGEARVVFDFTVVDGLVESIVFRAEPQVLGQVQRRRGPEPR